MTCCQMKGPSSKSKSGRRWDSLSSVRRYEKAGRVGLMLRFFRTKQWNIACKRLLEPCPAVVAGLRKSLDLQKFSHETRPLQAHPRRKMSRPLGLISPAPPSGKQGNYANGTVNLSRRDFALVQAANRKLLLACALFRAAWHANIPIGHVWIEFVTSWQRLQLGLQQRLSRCFFLTKDQDRWTSQLSTRVRTLSTSVKLRLNETHQCDHAEETKQWLSEDFHRQRCEVRART